MINPQDTTKPSRITRKRKRSWKISDLTGQHHVAILCLLPLMAVRFRTLKNTAVRPIALIIVNRFFYAFKKCTALIRAAYHSMVGHFLGAALLWPRSNPGFCSTAQGFEPLPVVTSHTQQVTA